MIRGGEKAAHTPLNSSVVSWTGDVSYIWEKFKKYDEFFITTYTRGSDEWYYKNIEYETMMRYVLQLKTISIINLCPIVCVHLVKCTIYKKKDGQVGTQTIFLNIE